MRAASTGNMLLAGVLVLCIGCERAGKTTSLGEDRREPTSRRVVMTAENNPTTLAQRGEPSLDDVFRPAAWVYIDGQEGRFTEEDGNPQVQWVIDGPVGASPTFRVEVFEPLLGVPRDFSGAFETIEAADGSHVAYGIAAADGAFEVGRGYQLLCPGDGFVIRNRTTGDVVTEIAPLTPGTYVLAAGIKNRQTGKEGVAITFFTVGEGG